MTSRPKQSPELSRSIGGVRLLLYGVGTMVGGGFYALSGRVAGEVGLLAPLAFLLAGLLALLSALSFAELSARLPHAGGSARYVEAAFESRMLAAVIGWAIIATGVVSAATLSVATVGFLRDLVTVDAAIATVVLVLMLGAVAAWGVRQAVGVVVAITIVEVGALLWIAGESALRIDLAAIEPAALLAPATPSAWAGVAAAAFIAFYAFIGFEDMVTMAEEVRDVRRTLPRALIGALVVTTLVYVVVSALLVLAVEPQQLADASTPLAEAVRQRGDAAVAVIVGVSILTGINGALVQIVMAARVGYGMASRGYAPARLATVHPGLRTPIVATLAATLAVLLLALSFGLGALAQATSAIILAVFAAVNLALWRLKRGAVPASGIDLPRFLPLLGAIASFALLLFRIVELLRGA